MNKHGFTIKYHIGESHRGRGIIIDENVKKGQLLWCYNGYGEWLNKEQFIHKLSLLSHTEQVDLMDHTYGIESNIDSVLHLVEDASFINHSITPNIGHAVAYYRFTGEYVNDFDIWSKNLAHFYALRDIKAGEELFEDYSSYKEPQWFIDMAKIIGSLTTEEMIQKFS